MVTKGEHRWSAINVFELLTATFAGAIRLLRRDRATSAQRLLAAGGEAPAQTSRPPRCGEQPFSAVIRRRLATRERRLKAKAAGQVPPTRSAPADPTSSNSACRVPALGTRAEGLPIWLRGSSRANPCSRITTCPTTTQLGGATFGSGRSWAREIDTHTISSVRRWYWCGVLGETIRAALWKPSSHAMWIRSRVGASESPGRVSAGHGGASRVPRESDVVLARSPGSAYKRAFTRWSCAAERRDWK